MNYLKPQKITLLDKQLVDSGRFFRHVLSLPEFLPFITLDACSGLVMHNGRPEHEIKIIDCWTSQAISTTSVQTSEILDLPDLFLKLQLVEFFEFYQVNLP